MSKPVTATPIMVRWEANGVWEPAIWSDTTANYIYAVGKGWGANLNRVPWADCGHQWRPAFMEEVSDQHNAIAEGVGTKLVTI